MSLILDALRKSDGERARQASERLREGPLPVRRAFPVAPLMLGISVLFLGAAVAIVLLSPVSPRSAAGAASEIMENGPAATVAPVRDLSAELAPPASDRLPEAAPEVAAEPATVTVETVVHANPEGVAVDGNELRAPPLVSLPADIRDQLPDLRVNVHAWSANPQERFVLINLRRYGEGDRLPEGPRVRRILRDGVVLEFEGNLFSLPRN